MNKFFGYLMIIGGFGTYMYYSYFITESFSDLAFLLVGFASAIVVGFGVGILNNQNNNGRKSSNTNKNKN